MTSGILRVITAYQEKSMPLWTFIVKWWFKAELIQSLFDQLPVHWSPLEMHRQYDHLCYLAYASWEKVMGGAKVMKIH